ncbi:MAG: hypothetical protein L3J43_02850, partial [Sulfurovum sp.]|nr:hypothetical protein [Sulfurovum sp.]
MQYLKHIILLGLLLPQFLFATWSVSADGRSASTPNPYSNFQNHTQTLTIAGQNSLTVTIKGEMEGGYDFVFITDSAGTTRRFDGKIDESYQAVGSTITIRYTTDYSVTKSGVTVSVKEPERFLTSNPKDFAKINIAGETSTNIYGDLMVIGNQSLCWKDDTNTCQKPDSSATNNALIQNHANLDPAAVAAGYLNSTSADLELKPNDRVVEAWLFTMGRLYQEDYSLRASAQNIRLKTPTSGGYIDLRADDDKFNWIIADYNWSFDYATAINITEYVQQGGRYWVADLKSSETYNQGSGWGIAVIVEDTTSQVRTLKNISLYNGYITVYNGYGYTPSITSNISGFFTPRSGTVKSNLIVMSAESDRALLDTMSVTKKDGTPIDIVDSLNNKNNIQNATISRNGLNVTDRNPNYENTLGIDIDEIDVSHIIENSQTSTNITITSGGDLMFLNMYGFATELYMPKFCYDYNIQKNGFSLKADESRNFTISGTGELNAHISLRSQEGDFDLENSKLKFYLNPSDHFNFYNAKYSPNTVNSLISAITTTQHTTLKPEIAIGAGATNNGGTIGIYERYFAQYNYKILKNETTDVHFTMELNTSIDFGSGPVEFLLSSENNTFPRCEQNLTYSPLYGAFNIERTDSGTYDPINEPQKRYPLYTQVANKKFDISIVSYDINSSPTYMKELVLPSDTVVDVELIDSAPYNDKGSFFKCQNTQEGIIQTLPNGEKSKLIKLNQNTTRTDISDIFMTPSALWNAAFRMWYFAVDGNVISHSCTSKTEGSCWRDNVYSKVKDTSLVNFCASDCAGNDSTDSCYKCLRQYYATPVCSRDNFAIKPASYKIEIFDTNESNITSGLQRKLVTNTTTSTPTLSAEYLYKVSVDSTQFGNNQKTMGYTTKFSTPSSNDKQSTVFFNSNTGTCADTNNTDWGLWFENGKVQEVMSGTTIHLQSNNLVSIPNAGNYTYHIEDSNWTIVDQARYVDKDGNSLKTFPDVDDCITNGTNRYSIATDRISQSGCGITSELSYAQLVYQDIPLQIQPYAFNLDQVNSIQRPNRNILFMNDLNNSHYGSVLSASISMATSFEGNVTAMGKQGTRLTNFTDGCAASDVVLDLSRTMLPQESTLTNVPM